MKAVKRITTALTGDPLRVRSGRSNGRVMLEPLYALAKKLGYHFDLAEYMLGLKRGVLHLVDYCEQWKRLYEKEETELYDTLGVMIKEIEHVGSTSLNVAGMIAKPILDVAVRVKNLKAVKESISGLIKLGYVYRGEQGIAGRHLFTKGDPVTVHLHMMLPGCSNWSNQVYFRDYLLEHPEKAEAYVKLKRELVEKHGGDRKGYMAGKVAFIEQMLLEARAKYEREPKGLSGV